MARFFSLQITSIDAALLSHFILLLFFFLQLNWIFKMSGIFTAFPSIAVLSFNLCHLGTGGRMKNSSSDGAMCLYSECD